jgi:hypothetical protein
MVAPLVMVTLMMSPFSSTPAWSMDMTLTELVHLSHTIHSWGVDSFGVGMINVTP